MTAIKQYPETEYLSDFSDFIEKLFAKWIGIIGVKDHETNSLLDAIAFGTIENYRISYLKFLLPYLAEKHMLYYRIHNIEHLPQSAKILHSMLVNDLIYNDNNVNRLAEILLSSYKPTEPYLNYPLHSDYKDIQKIIWTFIVQFKKTRNLPLVSDERTELY